MVRSDVMLTTSGIAGGFGIVQSTVRAYNDRRQMPKPTGYLGRTPYWSRADIARGSRLEVPP